MYGLQVWLVSVVVAGMGLTKIGIWLKDSHRQSDGNGKLMLAKDTGGFEREVILLVKEIHDLTHAMEDQRREDREHWGPGLAKLIEANTRTLEMLKVLPCLQTERDH